MSRTATSDGEALLLEQARGGDHSAFGELVRIHQNVVFRVIHRTSRVDAHMAEDLAQEVFLRAYQALPAFRGDCAFRSWILRIATNLTMNRMTTLSSRAERRAVSLDHPQGEGEQRMDVEDPTRSNPDSRLEGEELSEMLGGALMDLAPEYRDAVVLRDVEGLDYDAIAEVLEVPVGTVRSRLHRGREALREAISRTEGFSVLGADSGGEA